MFLALSMLIEGIDWCTRKPSQFIRKNRSADQLFKQKQKTQSCCGCIVLFIRCFGVSDHKCELLTYREWRVYAIRTKSIVRQPHSRSQLCIERSNQVLVWSIAKMKCFSVELSFETVRRIRCYSGQWQQQHHRLLVAHNPSLVYVKRVQCYSIKLIVCGCRLSILFYPFKTVISNKCSKTVVFCCTIETKWKQNFMGDYKKKKKFLSQLSIRFVVSSALWKETILK